MLNRRTKQKNESVSTCASEYIMGGGVSGGVATYLCRPGSARLSLADGKCRDRFTTNSTLWDNNRGLKGVKIRRCRRPRECVIADGEGLRETLSRSGSRRMSVELERTTVVHGSMFLRCCGLCVEKMAIHV